MNTACEQAVAQLPFDKIPFENLQCELLIWPEGKIVAERKHLKQLICSNFNFPNKTTSGCIVWFQWMEW